MAHPILLITTTCADAGSARTIAEALIAERLAACATIGAPVESAFFWDGGVQREAEVPLTVKTRADLWPTVRDRIAELHSYDLPEIVATAPAEVNEGYAAWVHDETRSD